MFNRREQLALVVLCGTFLAGSALALLDHYRPDSLEDFQVVQGAAVPAGPEAPADSSRAVIYVGPLDLNRATEAELEELPGIGPKTAASIVAYRRAHGPFSSVAALDAVTGIGPRTIERLGDRVVARAVEPAGP